ncbi:MAG: UbiA family prenyltransferase [Pseudomonadota bacterium]
MNVIAKIEALEAPLCVDLDGTLIRTDMLHESLFALIRKNPLMVFMIPIWLMRGIAFMKAEIASRVEIDVSTLPYNTELVAWLAAERRDGRSIYLATASNKKFAEQIADHLGLFDGVFASNQTTNLKSRTKCNSLQEAFGDGAFDYAGNAQDDIAVWKHAREAILVAPDGPANAWASYNTGKVRRFEGVHATAKDWLKAIRIHQWLKNSLLFVPIVLDQRLFDLQALGAVIVGFLAFGLCASSVYLLNDLLDLETDRRHPTKQNRPMAAGRISIQKAAIASGTLWIAAFSIAISLSWWFAAVLATYYVATFAYSLSLKRMLLIDVLTLAGLFTVRLFAGGAAAGLELSTWLLAFSMFFFLSLALVKRFVELSHQDENAGRAETGRGYRTVDYETLAQSGLASGFAAVMVLALYIDSDQVKEMFRHPELMWLVCPLVLYIIIRIWILARRNEMNDDPVVFLLTDWRSQIMVAAGAIVMIGGALL